MVYYDCAILSSRVFAEYQNMWFPPGCNDDKVVLGRALYTVAGLLCVFYAIIFSTPREYRPGWLNTVAGNRRWKSMSRLATRRVHTSGVSDA